MLGQLLRGLKLQRRILSREIVKLGDAQGLKIAASWRNCQRQQKNRISQQPTDINDYLYAVVLQNDENES